ncbi:MAG: glycoside hydrolase family 55 protein, partial [Chloroflexota bacterium]|nr:glycoside hydrolase family 55 protein [Chloroflexota bacterium]
VGSHRAIATGTQENASACCPDPADSHNSGDVVVPPVTREALPPAEPATSGRLRRLTDEDRGLWLQTEQQWLSLRGEVFDVRAYGALGDGVTDDWEAFNLAIEAMTSRLEEDSTSPYGRTLYVPPGTYRLAQTLIIDRAVRLVGASATGPNTDSVLQVDAGIIGIIIAAADPALTGQPGRRGDGTIIERLRITSATPPGNVSTPVAESAKTASLAADPASIHGVWLRARASIRDTCVEGFDGDGIHVEIGATGDDAAPVGTLTWDVSNCWVARCGNHGLAVRGSGGGLAKLFIATDNGKWGIQDESAGGSTYLQGRATGNVSGPFTSGNGGNRSLFVGCVADAGQPRSVFGDTSVVVAGDHATGYQGGNAWTADASRMLLQAQEPGTAELPLPTVPTLHIRGAAGQTQPHLRISDRNGGRLAEVDVAGRLLVGPADLTPAPPGGDQIGIQPVQVQISHPESGQAALRWVVDGETAAWVAQAHAYLEPGGTDDRPGPGGVRLTFQTPDTNGGELDTLTLRQGRVGIGTINPAPATLLDLASTTQGFLPPRMTTQQRDAILAPPEGLTIYNVTTKRLNFHDGTRWQEVAVSEAAPAG